MCLVEQPTAREIANIERLVRTDASASFILDLVTAALPMSLATVKAATDAAERATREEHDAALLGASPAAPRLRLVTPDFPPPGSCTPARNLKS